MCYMNDCLSYEINVTNIRRRLEDSLGDCYSTDAAVEWVEQALKIIGSDLGKTLSDFDLYFYRSRDNALYVDIQVSNKEEGTFLCDCLERMMRDEFLRLNANSDYYRLDIFAVLTVRQYQGYGVDIYDFKSACKAIARHLEGFYKIKAIWGQGSAQYDKGTEFENNEGYYLFFKAPKKFEGERIEAEVIRCFDNHGPCVPDDVAIEMDYQA